MTKPLLLCRVGTRCITSMVLLPDGSSGTSHTSRKTGCLTPPNRICRFLLAAAACRRFPDELDLILFSIYYLGLCIMYGAVSVLEY